DLAVAERELAALGPDTEALATEEAEFAERRRATLDEIDELSGSTAASAAAEVRGELRSLRTGIERSESDLRRLQTRHDALAERSARLDAEADRLRGEVEAAHEIEASLVADLEAAEAERLAAETTHDASLAARQDAAETASRWSARAEALHMALEDARSRAGADHLVGVDGVLGTLLELVEIDEGWEPAVEAALGESLRAVVVASPAAARAALSSLAASSVHGAVLALGARATATPTSVPGAVRPHVRGRRDGVDALLDRLLVAAVRAASWTEAVDLSLGDPTLVVVTDDGGRFGSSGWRIGATLAGATAAALDEARDRATAANTELARVDDALAAARGALERARQAEADLIRRLDAHDATFSANSEGLARVQAERRETQVELESVARSVAEVDERTARDRARVAELDALVPALEAEEVAEAAAARARGEARARLDAQAALLAGRRQDLEVRAAGLAERREFLERRLDETDRRLAADVAARAEAAERRLRVERSLVAVERLAAVVEGHRRRIEVRHNELLEARRRQSDEVRAIAGRLDDARRRRVAVEQDLETLRERGRRIEVDEAEVRIRLEGAIESLRRDHDLEPEAAEATEAPAVPEGSTPAGRVRDLERELRLMGPINPLALEEFNELQERHRFLEEQLEDVRNTRRDLLRVIKAVDLEIQTVFSAAFADVRSHFSSLFATLFPGGTGNLVLTSPDDLLATGIEVEAKPSGKNVKKLSLLSGGERSLTALAFLFAVFRSRPSPFYVMDEVEAALDDVNLHRFLGLVHEFRREAQLLIVSHQKRTMEAGDSLLGVSMQPGGSSKVVVERAAASA
ncbi:MAG: hypothetical protein ACKOA2_02880, partial [Ilumatobacteraceae bacterium]